MCNYCKKSRLSIADLMNRVPLTVIQSMCGKKLPALLEEMTGVSARTWKTGGPKYQATHKKAISNLHEQAIRKLQNAGLTRQEIVRFRENYPSGLWQQLVLSAEPSLPEIRCVASSELARQFDALISQLDEHEKAGNLNDCVEEILSSNFYRYGCEWLFRDRDFVQHLEAAEKATTWSDIHPLVADLVVVATFILLACWDVEFFSFFLTRQTDGYGLKPRPLFEMLMPRINPKLRRRPDGTYPYHGSLHIPVRRLLDISFCLATFYRSKGKWPDKSERKRDIIASTGGGLLDGEETGQPLAKLRKGLRKLTLKEYDKVFQAWCYRGDQTAGWITPVPLYLATQIWTSLFVRKNSKKLGVSGISGGFEERYRYWWQWYLADFKAKGCRFGTLPWPDFFDEL